MENSDLCDTLTHQELEARKPKPGQLREQCTRRCKDVVQVWEKLWPQRRIELGLEDQRSRMTGDSRSCYSVDGR